MLQQQQQQTPTVLRTLALLSKVIQRVCNVVVSERTLISKEPWQDALMTQICTDDRRRLMCRFLDRVSHAHGAEANTSADSVNTLKEGLVVLS